MALFNMAAILHIQVLRIEKAINTQVCPKAEIWKGLQKSSKRKRKNVKCFINNISFITHESDK